MKHILLGIIFITMNIGNLLGQEINTLRIDPINANGGKASEIFEEVKFIPLETTKKSLFSTIDQLVVTDKYFIILDQASNAIFIFNKQGKFYSKIGGETAGYKEQHHLDIFYFDYHRNIIAIHNINKLNCLIQFNFEGKQIGIDNSPLNYYFGLYFFAHNCIAKYLYSVDKRFPSINEFEISVLKNNIVKKKYFPYNTRSTALQNDDILHAGPLNNLYYQHADSSVLFTRSYDYDIYVLTPNTMKIKYKIILPLSMVLPQNFKTDTVFNGKRENYLMSTKGKVFQTSHPYQLNDNLFFKLNVSSGDPYSLLYNLKSGNLIDIAKISPDERSYFFSITDQSLEGNDFWNKNFSTTDGTYVYTFYSSLRLIRQRDLNSTKAIKYPPNLENYFKTRRINENPVIIQLKPKPNL